MTSWSASPPVLLPSRLLPLVTWAIAGVAHFGRYLGAHPYRSMAPVALTIPSIPPWVFLFIQIIAATVVQGVGVTPVVESDEDHQVQQQHVEEHKISGFCSGGVGVDVGGVGGWWWWQRWCWWWG